MSRIEELASKIKSLAGWTTPDEIEKLVDELSSLATSALSDKDTMDDFRAGNIERISYGKWGNRIEDGLLIVRSKEKGRAELRRIWNDGDLYTQAIAQAAECPYTLPLLVVGVSHINAEDFGMSQRDMANRIEREVICEENKNDEFDCYELQDSNGVFISIVESKEGLPRLYWLSQLACAGLFRDAKLYNKALDEAITVFRQYEDNWLVSIQEQESYPGEADYYSKNMKELCARLGKLRKEES